MPRPSRPATSLRVMLSSRCKTRFKKAAMSASCQRDPATKDWVLKSDTSVSLGKGDLTGLREALQARIEGYALGSYAQLFVVWMNENAEPQTLDQDAIDACIQEVRESDIVIVLYTEEEGFASPSGLGICVLEATEAFKHSPDATVFVDISALVDVKPKPAPTSAMIAWKEAAGPFSPPVQSIEDVFTSVDQAIGKMVSDWSRRSSRMHRGRGSRSLGPALEWSRMTLQERQLAMVSALEAHAGFTPRPGRESVDRTMRVSDWTSNAMGLRTTLSAIPGAMSEAASRSAWGRPDLMEHVLSEPGEPGTLHLVAVGGGVTESQARALLNNPNAFVVKTDFGVWASDEVQGTQLAFLSGCLDTARTLAGVDSLARWLVRSAELARCRARAAKRGRVIDAVRS